MAPHPLNNRDMSENSLPVRLADVSVVIPAYNAAGFIIDALQSITRQTLFPQEVIVIDDGSSDATYQVVHDWKQKENLPFTLHLQKQANKGLPATRNVGILQATGQWIALLDADDIWEPVHLQQLVAAVALRPSAVAAYGAGRLLVGDSINPQAYDDFWDNPSKKYGQKIDGSACLLVNSDIFPRLIQGNFIKPSSLMFAKTVGGKTMLFDENLRTAEDREFLVRMVFLGEFVYDPTPITQYRWHDDNISQGKNSKRNMENGMRALKVIFNNPALGLGGRDRAACHAQVRASAKEYLYICGQRGWSEYRSGLAFIYAQFGLAKALGALNPKHIVRSLVSRGP